MNSTILVLCHFRRSAGIELGGGTFMTHRRYSDELTYKLLTCAAKVTGQFKVIVFSWSTFRTNVSTWPRLNNVRLPFFWTNYILVPWRKLFLFVGLHFPPHFDFGKLK